MRRSQPPNLQLRRQAAHLRLRRHDLLRRGGAHRGQSSFRIRGGHVILGSHDVVVVLIVLPRSRESACLSPAPRHTAAATAAMATAEAVGAGVADLFPEPRSPSEAPTAMPVPAALRAAGPASDVRLAAAQVAAGPPPRPPPSAPPTALPTQDPPSWQPSRPPSRPGSARTLSSTSAAGQTILAPALLRRYVRPGPRKPRLFTAVRALLQHRLRRATAHGAARVHAHARLAAGRPSPRPPLSPRMPSPCGSPRSAPAWCCNRTSPNAVRRPAPSRWRIGKPRCRPAVKLPSDSVVLGSGPQVC